MSATSPFEAKRGFDDPDASSGGSHCICNFAVIAATSRSSGDSGSASSGAPPPTSDLMIEASASRWDREEGSLGPASVSVSGVGILPPDLT